MGSLDVSSAKDQFFKLVDAISASHLPSFTIWLDAKLAEYKTVGQLVPDSSHRRNEQYPEWIAKSLRQNLSFILPERLEDDSNLPTQSQSPRKPHKRRLSNSSASESPVATSDVGQKRRLIAPPDTQAQSEEERVVFIKEEVGVHDTDFPGQDEFSVATEALPIAPENDSVFSAGDVYGSQASHSSSFPANPQGVSDATAGSSEYKSPDQHLSHIASSDGKKSVLSFQSASPPAAQAKSDKAVGLAQTDASGPDWEFPEKKPFSCPYCAKVCRDLHTLRRHRVKHTGVKPYVCPHCQKPFSNLSSVYKHQETVHSDKPRLKVMPNFQD